MELPHPLNRGRIANLYLTLSPLSTPLVKYVCQFVKLCLGQRHLVFYLFIKTDDEINLPG